jgi:hypothetical protein
LAPDSTDPPPGRLAIPVAAISSTIDERTMAVHTHYLWFETKRRQEIIDITAQVAEQVRASGVR